MAQALLAQAPPLLSRSRTPSSIHTWAAMLPKAMKAAPKAAKSMTKTGIAKALATSCELKQKVCTKAINALAGIATKEVAKTGVFSLPGLCRLKTRTKPATKAGKREIFGKMCIVKAKPAKKVVKAFPAKAIKDSI